MVKKNFIKIFMLFVILLITTGCPEEMPELDNSIKIKNNSDENIIWCSFWNEDISASKFYWGDEIDDNYVIRKDSSGSEFFNTGAIKSHYEKNWWWKFYLLNLDSVRTIPWKQICDEHIWLKEVTFTTWEQMEACNFTITYP